LHGSASWLIKGSNEIVEKEFNLDEAKLFGRGSLYHDEVMIYPLLEKNLYQSPYVQMFYSLDREWENKRICIAIGYSFRDNVIKNIFTTYLKKDRNKRIILVDPKAKEITNYAFNDLAEQIIPIEKNFGNNDFHDVNSKIKETLFAL
jgi:hypothetical protein